jgi:diadenosine tetraphosphate (Ap4A) HIT family hydrolase
MNAGDRKLAGCTFCHEYAGEKPNVVAENTTMFVIPNRVSYDMFEGQRVIDHVMVIPKRHAESIGEFSPEEMVDQMTIVAEYEKRGYDVYARGVGSVARSVKHQHTHLIKCDNVHKHPRFLLFINKPYTLIVK